MRRMPTVTAIAGSENIGLSALESTTPLAGNASFTGATYDCGSLASTGSSFARFRAFAFADQAGTMSIQQSRTSSTWYTTTTAGVTASLAVILESILALRYVRVVYTNSATPQTVFELDSLLIAI